MPNARTLDRPVVRQPAMPMKPLVDPAGWRPQDLAASDACQYVLTPAEIAELDQAVAAVCARGADIKDMTLADFPLPTLDARLGAMKAQLMDGFGIAVLRGVPVQRYTIAEAAAAFWGIGLRLGVPVSQNYKGHLLGHVYDLVGPSRAAPSTRAYHTSAHLAFHSDGCDMVGLLCLQPAKSGGLSAVASTVTIYNEMLRRRPDLVAELIEPWYRDRRNEIPPGKGPWYRLPVFNFVDGFFSCFWGNYYIRAAQRFPELPRFTQAQQEALDMMDVLADELRFDMTFAPGDVQFLHNHVAVHGRTRYEDWPEAGRKRHLLRLWLATPGGRPMPDWLSDRYANLKPGERPAGVIVDNMELCAPLTPE